MMMKREGWTHLQVSSVLPDRVGQLASECVDQDLVLVKLKDRIGQPPLALERLSVAGRLLRLLRDEGRVV